MIQLPITNDPNQSFSASIPITGGNIRLAFTVTWNGVAGYWMLSISDSASGVAYITNQPMLYGNLLRQYQYLGIGNALVIPLTNKGPDSPGLGDWGTNFALVWA